MPIPKQNLILLPGFQTNSIILKDLIIYLDEYFNIHFIDFPGFLISKETPNNISFDFYTNYAQKEIEKLDLDTYLLGGISFGYAILQNLKLDNRCKGVLAIEPLLNNSFINDLPAHLEKLLRLINIVGNKYTYGLLWKMGKLQFIQEYLSGRASMSSDTMNLLIETTEPTSYFATIKIIREYSSQLKIPELPHVLVINPGDTTLMANSVIDAFQEAEVPLKIIHTEMEHFPASLDQKYFRKHLPEDKLLDISSFFEENSR